MKIEISMKTEELHGSYNVIEAMTNIVAEMIDEDPEMLLDMGDSFENCMQQFADRGGCDRIEFKMGSASVLETPDGVLMNINIKPDFVTDSGKLLVRALNESRPIISAITAFGRTLKVMAESFVKKLDKITAPFIEKWGASSNDVDLPDDSGESESDLPDDSGDC